MKSLVELLVVLVQDCMGKIGAPHQRDVETLRRRVEHEGDSFITITLPAFCKDLEQALARGRIAPGDFLGFAKTAAGIPRFLQGCLRDVFDESGRLLDEPSVDCISSVRQICLYAKKVRRPCSPERVAAATEAFVHCDQSIAEPTGPLWDTFKAVSGVLMDSLQHLERDSWPVPGHGPGATGEHIMGNQKWNFRRWHLRLSEAGFDFQNYGRAQGSYLGPITCDGDGVSTLEGFWPELIKPEDELPVRVVFVSKTQTSPRVIAVEPVCMQYAQQALKNELVRSLERNRFTAGHVNFRDQSVNQVLALDASHTGLMATLDMSEASDRVSLEHAMALLNGVPRFREKVMAARSTRAELPDGRVIDLKKFASMGSALCFPIEALVFFTSIIASRIRRAKASVNTRTVMEYGRSVYVYGDDLIVPSDEAPAICADLEALGFKVNTRKSFWTGRFRESCGTDAYDGQRVTPVYLRTDVPTDRTDVSGLLSIMATTEQLYSAGLFASATELRKSVESIWGKFPQVAIDSPAVGWSFHSEERPSERWNDAEQRREKRCWTITIPAMPDPLDGDGALAKCFRMIGLTKLADMIRQKATPQSPRHLEESVRPYSLNLKRRWVPAV